MKRKSETNVLKCKHVFQLKFQKTTEQSSTLIEEKHEEKSFEQNF